MDLFIFPLSAAIVSFVFSFLLLKQYLDRRKPYQLAWCVSLAFFGIGAAAETVATVGGWNELLVKIYYIFGATLIVGVLGLGSLYVSGDYDAGSPVATFFLGRRFNALIAAVFTFILWFFLFGLHYKMLYNNINISVIIILMFLVLMIVPIVAKKWVPGTFLFILLIGGGLAIFAILSGSIDPAKLSETQGWHALNRTLGMRSAALGFSTYGSLVVITGAILSAISLLRKHIMRDRAFGNILIALGVLIVAGGGTMGGLLGLGGQAAISVPMAVGVAVMFAGFIKASGPAKK